MKERTDYVQWEYEMIRNAYLNRPDDFSYTDKLYLDYLHPFSMDIFGPRKTMLLFGGHEFAKLSPGSVITARDGVIPLTLFFQECTPEDVQATIFIHKDFWFLVPQKWQKSVKFYDVKAHTEYSALNLPKRIFVSGMLNSTLADPDELEEGLKKLSDTLGPENIAKMEVMAYFPNKRNDLWGSWDDENVLKFSALLFKYLKLEIKTPTWARLYQENDFKDCLYYEINSGLFIQNSYLNYFSLSRGAGLLKQEELVDKRFTLTAETKASIYHSYRFYDFDYTSAPSYEDAMDFDHGLYYKRAINFFKKDVRVNFYWEKWYASYMKTFYKTKKKKNRLP